MVLPPELVGLIDYLPTLSESVCRVVLAIGAMTSSHIDYNDAVLPDQEGIAWEETDTHSRYTTIHERRCGVTDVALSHVCPCRFSLWAIQQGSRQFHSQLNKQPGGRPCVQDAKPFISASGSQGLVCGVAAVCSVANWPGEPVDPESACSHRSRPLE